MRQRTAVVTGLLSALVASLLAQPPAAAEEVPPPLGIFDWGTKPAGMVVGSFEQIQQEYWDEATEETLTTQEPGGLAAWRRGCFYEPDCWARLTGNATDQVPAWSPSGYQVAFLRGDGDTRSLMVLDTRTGEERVVLSTNHTISAPTWSPDEQQLAFSRARWIEPEFGEPYLGDHGLYITGAFGGATATRSEPEDTLQACAGTGLGLMDVHRVNPQWAADGRIIYMRQELAAADGFCSDLSPAAWTPGGSTEFVHSAASVNAGLVGPAGFVEPSPDGSRVAVIPPFASWQENAIHHWPETPGPTVTLGGFSETPASWAPSGRSIVVGSEWLDPGTGEELPRWVETEFGTVLNPDIPIAPGRARTYETQCNPGNCLSGIMVVIDGNGVGLGNTVLSGAVDAVLDLVNDSVLRRKPSGTYAVTATPPTGASVTAITCDDDNSGGDPATRTATFRVDGGELVVCTFVIGQPDADNDGLPDDIDPCPVDATNRCDDDSDGDGIVDPADPCPTDPRNTCDDPPPPPEPDRCRTHSAIYQAMVAGTSSPVLQFALNDVRWCSNGKRSVLTSKGSVAYDDVRSPSLAVLMKLVGISFKYRGGSVSALQSANGSVSLSGTGKVSFCAQIPVAGSVVRLGVKKALALLPAPVRKKIADWAIKKIAKSSLVPERIKKKIVVLGVAAVLRVAGASDRELTMFRALVNQAYALPTKGLLALVTEGVCVPGVWLPQIDIDVNASGAPTVGEHGTTGIFTVRPYGA